MQFYLPEEIARLEELVNMGHVPALQALAEVGHPGAVAHLNALRQEQAMGPGRGSRPDRPNTGYRNPSTLESMEQFHRRRQQEQFMREQMAAAQRAHLESEAIRRQEALRATQPHQSSSDDEGLYMLIPTRRKSAAESGAQIGSSHQQAASSGGQADPSRLRPTQRRSRHRGGQGSKDERNSESEARRR